MNHQKCRALMMTSMVRSPMRPLHRCLQVAPDFAKTGDGKRRRNDDEQPGGGSAKIAENGAKRRRLQDTRSIPMPTTKNTQHFLSLVHRQFHQ